MFLFILCWKLAYTSHNLIFLAYRGASNNAALNSANLEQRGFQFVPELFEQRGFLSFFLEQHGFGLKKEEKSRFWLIMYLHL